VPLWTPKFLDRIKQSVDPNRLKQRLDEVQQGVQDQFKQTLAPQVPEPEQEFGTDIPHEHVDDSFAAKIKERVRQIPEIQRRMLDPQAALSPETIRYRIRYAGQNRLLLLMQYNSTWRHVEPYSYRWRGKTEGATSKKSLRFFGFCKAHNKIHAFKPDKIQGLIVTDQSFQPRWPIELA
jgi:hypothetical protein